MKVEFAIVDIETTGGYAGGSRITEIAIVIHDGSRIVERWETLVNPEKEIPLPIFALTGISNDMVRDAPVFDDLAPTVHAMLRNRVFVAHNVNFDYSFVRHQLQQAGINWTAPKLCTVRAARRICPGLRSYALANLCQALEIPHHNRHRAGGDADATALLFSKLSEWDQRGDLEGLLRKGSAECRLPPNVPKSDFDVLPRSPGVYYFHDRAGKVVYVGKAINLKSRVSSHFTGHNINPQRQNFLRDIFSITFEVCATELIALLLECSEIRRLWPKHNRALKRFEPKFGLFEYEARSGHRYLAVGKLSRLQRCVMPFHSQHAAVSALVKLAAEHQIDTRFCQFGTVPDDLMRIDDSRPLPGCSEHNSRVETAIQDLLSKRPTFAIIDNGRDLSEKSCVLIEDGDFYGMGYFPVHEQIGGIDQLKNFLVRYPGNQYAVQLALTHAQKFPMRVKSAVAIAECS